MKIKAPVTRMVRVGDKVSSSVDIFYDDPNRPNILGSVRVTEIKEPRVSIETVFDYDFQFVARAKGVGRMALFTGSVAVTYGVVLPLAFVAAGIQATGEFVLNRIVDPASDLIGDLNEAAGIRLNGVPATFRALWAEIVR